MSRFRYSARNAGGNLVTGEEDSVSSEALAAKLKLDGLLPLDIESTSSGGIAALRALWKRLGEIGTIPLRDKALFFRQLSLFLGAGLPLPTSLVSLEDSCACRPLAVKIARVRVAVLGGIPLPSAVQSVGILDTAGSAMLKVGDETGDFAKSASLIADRFEMLDRLKGKIISAMAYPAIVMAFALMLLYFMMGYMLPRLLEAFSHMNISLPALTVKVLAFGRNLPLVLSLCCAFLILTFVSWRFLRRYRAVRLVVGHIALKLPVIGKMRRNAILSKVLRSLGSLISAGVSHLDSLDICADMCGNAVIEDIFRELSKAIVRGEDLGEKVFEFDELCPVASQLVAAGSKTGSLDKMLLYAADWYELDFDNSVQRFSDLISPLLIIIVGALVGVVALAVYSPMLHAMRSML